MSRFSVLLLLLFLSCFHGSILQASGEQLLNVILPASLRNLYPSGIPHNSALFGFPQFGASITGSLVYAGSNALGCDSTSLTRTWAEDEVVLLMIDRGNCSFTTKIRNAEMIGAKAVIIANNDDTRGLPLMADDGNGGDIEIPSMIIWQRDANVLKANLNATDVTLMMKWSLPNPDRRVEIEMWTSSSILDDGFVTFKSNFAKVAALLGDQLYVEPHYYIVDGSRICMGINSCGTQCVNGGRYCAADPELDATKGIDGADVVTENLRQICVWNYLNSTNQVPLWWSYVTQFDSKCAGSKSTWTQGCSESIMKSLNIDVSIIRTCFSSSGGVSNQDQHNSLLDAQITAARQSNIYYIPSITINGVVYHGSTYCPSPVSQDHCGVFQAVCSGYPPEHMPAVCVPGCPIDNLNCNDTSSESDGPSLGVVFAIVIAFLVFGGILAFFYIRRQRQRMREELDSILASYMPIDDTTDQDGQSKEKQNLVSSRGTAQREL